MTARLPGFGHCGGFTLTELAIVLLIVGLLIGGLLFPLSAQVDLRRHTETQAALGDIRDALVGFAIIEGRLPCPDTDAPGTAGYGEENTPCAAPAAEGYLPWKTLGVPELDAWGSRSTIRPQPGDWRYRVDGNFSIHFTLVTTTADALEVRDAQGNALTASTQSPIAIVYSAGPDGVASGLNASFDKRYQGGERDSGFDDITIWISRPTVMNRMIAAGRLP